ncbi:MAG: hypothetical protein AAF333_13325 [Planctomycetota bacterium]
MQITMTKTTRTKDGALWPAGAKFVTDAAELKRRGVPEASYRVEEESAPAPSPGNVRTSDVPTPRKKKTVK